MKLESIYLWFSFCALNILISLRGSIVQTLIGIMISSILSGVLILKKEYHKKYLIKVSSKKNIIAIIFTIFSLEEFCNAFILRYITSEKVNSILDRHIENIELLFRSFAIILSIIGFYSLLCFWRWCLEFTSKFIIDLNKEFERFEKIVILLGSIIGIVLVIFIFYKTNIFYCPISNNKKEIYDVIFTSDTGSQYITNVFMNIAAPENDIRQPLFGLYSLPIGTVAYILSKVFYFVPDSYALFLQIFQILLVIVTSVFLERILKLNNRRLELLFILCYLLSYSVLIWLLPLEQYIICLFYLILFIYLSLNKKNNLDIFFIGATGTLITSVFLFPLLFYKNKINKNRIITKIMNILGKFLLTIILVGQTNVITTSFIKIIELSKYMGIEISGIDKFKQFLNFVSSIFVSPKIKIELIDEKISYQLAKVENFNIIGVIILLILIFYIFRGTKSKESMIYIGWIFFSFIILFIFGWGTMENGLILYGLYFSWAYISIIFKIFNYLIAKNKTFYILVVILIFILGINNIKSLIELINFGINYYGKN